MDARLEDALRKTIDKWTKMGQADMEHSEDAADQFEHSFYVFIDVFRDWVNELKPRPSTVEELLAMDTCQEIISRLPAPLMLNFETEADLIIENTVRVDEDKYD
jgi:hypothetical protein